MTRTTIEIDFGYGMEPISILADEFGIGEHGELLIYATTGDQLAGRPCRAYADRWVSVQRVTLRKPQPEDANAGRLPPRGDTPGPVRSGTTESHGPDPAFFRPETPRAPRSLTREALEECRAALYGCRALAGSVGNIDHAICLADSALKVDAR